MASEKKIRRRIKSAKNISQITKAMQMVAASKLRRAQEKAIAGKPYAQEVMRLVREARERLGEKGSHPLLQKGSELGQLVILISTNKGLCGSLNTDLFRKVEEWFPRDLQTSFVTLGAKGQGFMRRSARGLIADFSAGVFLDNVPALSRLVQEGFVSDAYGQVWLAYTEFISALKHTPVRIQLLPFSQEVFEQEKQSSTDLLVEPDYGAVLKTLLPHVIEIQLRKAILEAEASEHASRMLAMKNATDNANDLMESLTLAFNRLRQEKITNEIADMVTARMAVQ